MSMSTWESPVALELGSPLPPPFTSLVIGELLSRTATGGYLYRVKTHYAIEAKETEAGAVE